MTSHVAGGDELLKQLDDSRITRAHWKILFISGMGFFTDAYDLIIIGIEPSSTRRRFSRSTPAPRVTASPRPPANSAPSSACSSFRFSCTGAGLMAAEAAAAFSFADQKIS